MKARRIRIGARSSKLSQSQVSIVSSLLGERFGSMFQLEFVPVKTFGDRKRPALRGSYGPAGAKGAFTGDLESLLSKGEIDLAIHSMKDLPSEPTRGLTVGATPRRSDPRDALVANDGGTFERLPRGAKIGTSSLRRKAQLLKMRRDVDVVDVHGNVDTRIRKAIGEGSDLDAIVLAVAGLERIGEGDKISQTFSIDEVVPAVGQGIIAVQVREDDREMAEIVSGIDHLETRLESSCERAFARRLGADCSVPVGGCAKVSRGSISMVGMLASKDCEALSKRSVKGASGDGVALGASLAEELLDSGRLWAAS
ncbi:MAG: hydroxymethylbilane synthase [Thaumarchaeota archaeon]|nr:hydroxymethylbilane synthase [Nitrososphaerota archaeon]